ncbi:MAG: Uncharacterised protein [Bacteroidia bacterium]|jgi:hypothetical protein|nr:MAG: Uncharacterised protein [Bacteroidia bacterium]
MKNKWLSSLRAKIKGTENESSSPEYYIGLGLCFGVAFGAALGNIGLGISLGLVIGVAVQKTKNKKA